MSDQSHQFAVGDRVRVSEEWFHTPLRGAVGIVADGSGVVQADQVWVEFDPPVQDDGSCVAAAFSPDALTKL